MEDIEAALQQRLLIGLGVFLAALVTALLTATWFARQLSRPVHELVGVTQEFISGQIRRAGGETLSRRAGHADRRLQSDAE